MLPMLMSIIAGMLVAMALLTTGITNPANYNTAVVADSPAPESPIYGGAANMATAANTTMERYKLTSVEQSLVGICRATYWMGKSNNCSGLNENFTWSFLLQGGASNSLNSILSSTPSSTFSCSTPAQYGVYLMQSLYASTDLSRYSYNLNIYNSGTGTTQTIGSTYPNQADPCAYADIVN